MKTCAKFRIRLSDLQSKVATSDLLLLSDELIDEIGTKVGEAINQPVTTGVFSGCTGRLVGGPDVSTAMCFFLESLSEDSVYLASLWCLESPANRFIFLRRPITEAATKNLESVIASLESIFAADSRMSDLEWMDVDEWARGEQAVDGNPH